MAKEGGEGGESGEVTSLQYILIIAALALAMKESGVFPECPLCEGKGYVDDLKAPGIPTSFSGPCPLLLIFPHAGGTIN